MEKFYIVINAVKSQTNHVENKRYTSYTEAEECTKALCTRYGGASSFVIMEAIYLAEPKCPPVVISVIK